MYAGRIVESGKTKDLFVDTKHPYTRALHKSRPALQPKGRDLYTIPGMPPDLSRPIEGCPFAPRCEYAVEYCRRDPVLLKEVAPQHSTACLRVQRGDLKLSSSKD
jgi:oligopeptide transport system ATP-binding protein